MRHVCSSVAALLALTMFAPPEAVAQGSPDLAVTGYQFISEQRSTRTHWFVTYRAELTNTGQPRSGVTATLTSLVPTVQTVPGQSTLHFPAVASNGRVNSIDTFTILVDRSVNFDFSNLRWAFLNPVANAGANQTAPVGTTVTLNGSGSSNPSGAGTLGYAWSFVSRPAGSAATLSSINAIMPSFVIDVPGNYVVVLTVNNGAASDTATVTVSTLNSPPIARAGSNQTVGVGSNVTVNAGSSSDVDGDPLTYFWSFVSQPAGSAAFLANFRSVSSTFIADKPGSYIVQLVVNDGKVDSTPATVTITTINTPPVANAGPDQTVSFNALVQLNGAASTDVNGDQLVYKWSLITRPANSTAILSNPGAVNPTFTADRQGSYVAQLIVNDGKIDSAPATVTITTNAPQSPTANAGSNQTVVHGASVTLSGSGTDPQNLPLQFTWSLVTRPVGSTAVLSASNVANPTFVADKIGSYVAQLIVGNGTANSSPSTVTITTTNTAPVANAGPNQNVLSGAVVALNGSASSDADSDPLSFTWSFTSRPPGSSSVLSAAASATPTFIPDVAGTYVVQLIVNDGFANSVPATVTVTADAKKITLAPDPLNLTNASVVMTVNLTVPAGPNGVVVTFSGYDPAVISLPPNVTIPANASGYNVTVTPLAAGSTNVLATAPGYQPASAVVNVNPASIAVGLTGAGVGIGRTLNGTVTLSSPAPSGGTAVTLSASPLGLVSFTPPTVTVPAGSTTASFVLNGVAEGTATITGSSAGYVGGSTTVLVANLGAVAIASNVTVGAGQSTSLTIVISTPAPMGGLTISLVSSDPSKLQVPQSVIIPGGASAPAAPVQITGIGPGTATVTASATGYTSDSKVVQISAALSFSQTSLSIAPGATQNLTLNISGTAPAGGLNVTLTSSNPGAVSVPSGVSIAANTSSVTVPVTGIAAGSSTITASTATPNVTSATAGITVTAAGTLNLPSNLSLTLGQSKPFPISLSTPAPQGGVVVTLSSSAAGKVSILPASVTIDAGQTQPAVQPQVTGVSVGAANITASASGYGSAFVSVQTTASLSLAPGTLTISGTETKNLTVTLSGPAPAGGITVNISATPGGIVNVPATVSITANATTATIPVTGLSLGSTTLTASAQDITSATAGITVQTPGAIVLPANLSVGLGQSIPLQVTLPAPAPAGGVTVALSSSDSAKVSLSTTSVTIPAGATQPTTAPQITGVNVGSANITASAPTYTSATQAVQVTATISLAPQNLTITGTQTQNLTLTLSGPAPVGGITFNLTSSNTGVATVPANVTIPANAASVTIPVTGVAAGSTTIRASAPSFTDATAGVTVNVSVDIILPTGLVLGPGVTVPFTVRLAQPAQSLTFIQLAISDPSKASLSLTNISINAGQTEPQRQTDLTTLAAGVITISASANGLSPASTQVTIGTGASFVPSNLTISTPGIDGSLNLVLSTSAASAINFSVTSSNPNVAIVPPTAPLSAGSTSVSLKVTALAPGTTTITASAPGFANTTATVVVEQPGTITMTASKTSLQIAEFATLTLTLSKPAPNQGTTINLTSTHPKIKVSPASITIPAGATVGTTQVMGSNVGTGVISASAIGFTPPAPVTINVGSVISWVVPSVSVVGGGQQLLLDLMLHATVPGGPDFSPADGIVVTLTSSRPDVATVVPQANFFWDGSTAPITRVQVNTVSPGTTIITASGINIPPVTMTVIVTGPIAITTPSLPNGNAGSPYSFTMAANGGVAPLRWSATGLPSPLVINQNTGQITGTPTAASSGQVSISVTDSSSPTPLTATATFTLTISVGTPTSLTVSSGSSQSAVINTAFAAPLKALVRDASNNPVSGVTVTFTAPGGAGASGSFAGGVNTATTDAAGIATSAAFTANAKAGSYAVTASAAGGLSTTFSLSNTAGPAASMTLSSGSPQSAAINAPFSSPLAVLVKDAGDNPVSGVVVTFTPTPASGGASGSFASGQNTATTNASGIATSQVFTANSSAGQYVVTAAAGNLSTPFTLTNTTTPPASISIVSGSGQSAAINTPFASPLKVLVKDAGQNPLSGITVTFVAPGSGASGTFAAGQNTAVTDGTGVATSAAFTANAAIGTYNVTASVAALTTNFSLTNTVGAPASVAVSAGSGQTAGVNQPFASPLQAIVKDAGNNPVSGVTVTFSAPGSGASGAFAGGQNTAVTNAAGVATSTVFTANGTLGAYNVAASVGALTANFALTNTVGTPASISVVSGSSQTTNTGTLFPNPLKAIVKDAGNNPVSGVTVSFSAPGTGASGTFAGGQNTAVTDAAGVATSVAFTANAVAGTYNVTASAGALNTSFALTNQVGPPAEITVVSGSGQGAQILSPFPNVLKAKVVDANGNPSAGVTVTFIVPATGASAAFAGGVITAVTDAAGIATSVALSANLAVGTYTVLARVNQNLSTGFALTNQPGPPAIVTIVDGNDQSAAVNTAFVKPLTVRVTDAGGNPLRTVQVTFNAPSSGASGVFSGPNTALTDSLGLAVSQVFSANQTFGSYTVNAQVAGIPTPAAFNLTNGIGTSAGIITVANATIGLNLQAPITITLNPAPPAAGVVLTITSSDPSKLLVGNSSVAGSASLSPLLTQGQNSVSTFAQALVGSGTATITFSAPGYTTATSTITFAPSGFVISGSNGIGGSFNVAPNTPTPLTVFAGRLDGTGVFAASQQVRGGFAVTVPLSNAVPSVGSLSAPAVNIVGGNDTGSVQFTGSQSGGTTVSVGTPPGFATPATGTSVNITVQGIGISVFNETIGNNLQKAVTVSLSAPVASARTVTITSNDPSKLKFSTNPTGAGSASITRTIPINQSNTGEFYAQSFGSSGSVGYTVVVDGLGSANGTVTLAPAGLVIQSPGGFSADFSAPLGTDANIVVITGPIIGGIVTERQAVAGGQSLQVTVASGNTAVATITSSPLTIPGGSDNAITFFHPVSQGTSSVTASASLFTSASVNGAVTSGGSILLNGGLVIGKNLQGIEAVTLPAGAGERQVTVTSNSGLLKLSATATGAGTSSIVLTLPAGTNNATFYVQSLTDSGTATYTATSAGLGPATRTAAFAKSGVVLVPSTVNGSVGGVSSITAFTALLDDASNPVEPQALAGGAALQVSLSNQDPGKVTVPASITIQPGIAQVLVPVTFVATGSSLVQVQQPAGWSTPTILTSTMVNVN